MWDRVVHGAQASARVCFSPFLLVSHVDRLVVGWVIRGGPVVKNLPAKELEAGDTSSIPGLGRSPGEGNEWQPTSVFLLGESHEQRSLVGCSSWGCQELDMTERLRMHAV